MWEKGAWRLRWQKEKTLSLVVIFEVGLNSVVTWKPFFLNPNIPPGGVPLRTYLGSVYGEKRLEIMSEHLHQKGLFLFLSHLLGKEVGINFLKDRLIVPTLNSHRLLEFALRISPEKQNAIVDKIFYQYFEEGKNISDIDVLVSIAESCGVEGRKVSSMTSFSKGVREYMKTDQDKQSIIDQDHQWKRMRIGGVPLFSIYIQGKKRRFLLIRDCLIAQTESIWSSTC